MTSFFIRLAFSAVTLVVLSQVSDGAIHIGSWGAAFIAALFLGLANAFIKPIVLFVLSILTLPLTCLTLGLWTLVLSWLINAALFCVVANNVKDFGVSNFGAALLGSLALSLVNAIASAMLSEDKKRK